MDSAGRGMRQVMGKSGKLKKLTPEQIAARRRKIWMAIAKKDIPKVGIMAATTNRVASVVKCLIEMLVICNGFFFHIYIYIVISF